MSAIGRYYRTVKHLRPRQVWTRVVRRVVRPRLNSAPAPERVDSGGRIEQLRRARRNQENRVTRKARILVIEDEDTIRTLITSALEQLGHDVIEAENGQVAERHLDEDRFDLVVTDLIMPERDGLEVIRDLRANHPDTRILAASTPSTLMLLEIAKLMGAHATIAKPYTLGELTESVSTLLGSSQVSGRAMQLSPDSPPSPGLNLRSRLPDA